MVIARQVLLETRLVMAARADANLVADNFPIPSNLRPVCRIAKLLVAAVEVVGVARLLRRGQLVLRQVIGDELRGVADSELALPVGQALAVQTFSLLGGRLNQGVEGFGLTFSVGNHSLAEGFVHRPGRSRIRLLWWFHREGSDDCGFRQCPRPRLTVDLLHDLLNVRPCGVSLAREGALPDTLIAKPNLHHAVLLRHHTRHTINLVGVGVGGEEFNQQLADGLRLEGGRLELRLHGGQDVGLQRGVEVSCQKGVFRVEQRLLGDEQPVVLRVGATGLSAGGEWAQVDPADRPRRGVPILAHLRVVNPAPRTYVVVACQTLYPLSCRTRKYHHFNHRSSHYNTDFRPFTRRRGRCG